MTKVIFTETGNRIIIIEDEEPGICEECGKLAEETRPYGINFKRICYECGMKDLEGTNKRMNHLLYGDPL
jgi:hypothetical protein